MQTSYRKPKSTAIRRKRNFAFGQHLQLGVTTIRTGQAVNEYQFEQTGHQDTESLASQGERKMQRFLKQDTSQNYHVLLAKERSEAERVFLLTVLARKGAEDRRRPVRGWLIVQGQRLVESR
jgi:hypothetical protein